MFFSLIGLAGSVVQWIIAFAAYMTLVKWAYIAVVLVVAYLIVKLGTTMLEFLSKLLANKILRKLVISAAILGLGIGIGACSHLGHIAAKNSMEKHINVKNSDVQVRSKGGGILVDGHIFYKADFINKVLERLHVQKQFKVSP